MVFPFLITQSAVELTLFFFRGGAGLQNSIIVIPSVCDGEHALSVTRHAENFFLPSLPFPVMPGSHVQLWLSLNLKSSCLSRWVSLVLSS